MCYVKRLRDLDTHIYLAHLKAEELAKNHRGTQNGESVSQLRGYGGSGFGDGERYDINAG
jgi:hypothetical protein